VSRVIANATPRDIIARASSVEAVRELEDHLNKYPQIDIETTHVLHGNTYSRTIFIPAGMVVTGALMSLDHVVIMHGDITMVTTDGFERLTGHHVIPVDKGKKRAAITHQDTWWTTVNVTSCTDVPSAEDEMTTESGSLLSRRVEIRKHEAVLAQQDYEDYVSHSGMTHAMISRMMLQADDHVDTDACTAKCFTNLSHIHGIGLFAKVAIEAGECIAPGRIGGKRCLAGRMTNHSHDYNSVFRVIDGFDIALFAVHYIPVGTEITCDYRASQRVNTYLPEGELCRV
jgi:SET domain